MNTDYQPFKSKLRWGLIILYLLITVFTGFINVKWVIDASPIVSVLCLFAVVCLHGKEFYGVRNFIIFFLITWFVSHSFEALSIRTGFPFGHYYYDQLVGPRILDVPLIIMFGYFGTGYLAWILSHIFLGQYEKKLVGKQIFLIPLVATFLMVIWDVCMDPISSTAESLWVWTDGGPYFGVPLQNYFGWFFVVFIFSQIFALYIAKFDRKKSSPVFTQKLFWMEAIALYGIQGLSQIMNPFTQTHHLAIYSSMAMVSIFTMLFLTLLAFLILKQNKELV